MLPLTKKELKLHWDSTECCICWKWFLKKFANDKHYRKSYGPHIIYAIAHSICNLRFDVPLEIPVSFYSGSNYDNNFIINQLANEFEQQFECVEESTEKYKTFSVPIEKEVTNIDKDGNGSVVTISYKIKFIDSVRFMASSLSNLFDNVTEGIHEVKCRDCNCFLEYESVKDNLMKYKCLSYNKDYSNKLVVKIKKMI